MSRARHKNRKTTEAGTTPPNAAGAAPERTVEDPANPVRTIDMNRPPEERERIRLPSEGGQETEAVEQPKPDEVQAGLLGADRGAGPASTQAGNLAQDPAERPDEDEGT